jgi:hypothetical protein
MDITYTIFKSEHKCDWEMTTTHKKISKDQDSGSIKNQKQINHPQMMMEVRRKNPRSLSLVYYRMDSNHGPCVNRDHYQSTG